MKVGREMASCPRLRVRNTQALGGVVREPGMAGGQVWTGQKDEGRARPAHLWPAARELQLERPSSPPPPVKGGGGLAMCPVGRTPRGSDPGGLLPKPHESHQSHSLRAEGFVGGM